MTKQPKAVKNHLFDMEKFFLVAMVACLILFFPMNGLHAQSLKPNTRYFGYFINQQHDTIRGFILFTNKVDMQEAFEFANDPSATKIHFTVFPEDICCFHFSNYTYEALLYGGGGMEDWSYLMQRETGVLKLYQYFFIPKTAYLNTGSLSRPVSGSDEQYLQWDWVIVKDIKPIGFSNENELVRGAAKIFEGDDALIQHIKNKEKNFRWEDMPELVASYNEFMTKNSR